MKFARPARIVALVAAVVCGAVSLLAQAPVYDIVIRHGRVLDGMGNPWIAADVAIKDGRFAAVGRIDGRGRAGDRRLGPLRVARLDRHDGPVRRRPPEERARREQAAHGRDDGDRRRRRDTGARGARRRNTSPGSTQSGISINFGSYYSETQARTAVLGNTAREPTGEELVRMQALMDTAMRGGAMGMTTALIYPPSSYAKTPELVEVAKIAAKYGGTYATHMRDEGKDLLQSIEEAIAIGEQAGLAVEIFHLKAAWQPGWGTLMARGGPHD